MATDQFSDKVDNGTIYYGLTTETGDRIPKFNSAFKSFRSPKTANKSDCRQRRLRVKRRGAGLFAIALLAAALHSAPVYADENDAVSVWNARAAVTLVNGPAAGGVQFPPPVAFIHLAMVQGAVYDAVNAIKGGHDPYLKGLKAATSASKDAAAATAAHHVLIGIVNQAPSPALTDFKSLIKAGLDKEYASSLAEIPDGEAKTKGIEVGAAAAAAMLAKRVGDGRFTAGGFPEGSAAGDWRPLPQVATEAVNDPNGWVRNVRPFALPSPGYFQTSGPPLPLTSAQYTQEFNEVKELGAANSISRTPAQTSLAIWSTRHPVLMLSEAMREVAVSKKLTISEQARFHAMTSMAGADSLINCWAEKARWSFWRPSTAIRLAADDGNPATEADVQWTALLGVGPAPFFVPPYPDEPSGANCLFSGVMNSAKAFFGSDEAQFKLAGNGSTRQYLRFSDVVKDMIDARVWGGLHFRRADDNGALLGQSVANFVDRNYFNCRAPGQCKQEERE